MDSIVYKAAESGSVDFLRWIGDHNSELLRQETPDKATVLHIAVTFKRKEFVTGTICLCPLLLTQADSKGDTPLHVAAKIGSSDIAKLLIDSAKTLHVENPRINEAPEELLRRVNLETDTALHVAVRNGHFDVMKLLIDSCVELVHLVNSSGESPLYLAVERVFFNIAQHILQTCPSCAHAGTNGMTALHAAVIRTHDDSGMGNPLSELYREVSRHFTSGSTHRLFWRLEEQIVPFRSSHIDCDMEGRVPDLSLEGVRRLFLDSIFHIREFIKGFFPRQINTSETSSFDIVKLLLEQKKELIKEADIFMWTPLHYAAHLGHLEATKLLLQSDSSVAYLSDEEHSSALHVAAKKGHIDIMKQLIEFRPDTYKLLDKRGRTALHVAVESGMVKVVKYILKTPNLESLINEPDKEGNTPLHLAAICRNYSILKILRSNNKVNKRAMNKKYMKAIDIVQSNMDIVGKFRKFWMAKKLEADGGRQSLHRLIIRENPNTQNNDSEGRQETLRRIKEVAKQEEIKFSRLKDISRVHLLVGTLIATVTFAAGFTTPGGFKNNGADEGKATLATKTAFKAFVITDGIAFYCSTASIFLHFFASLEHNYYLLLRFIRSAATLTYISILAMVIAFTSGIFVVLPSSSGLSIAAFVIGCIFLSFYIFGVL